MTRSHPVWLDRIGIVGALLCAVHCAAMPLLMLTVPLSVLSISARGTWQHETANWILRLHGYEKALVLATLALAAVSLVLGWRRHRRVLPALFGTMAGLSLGAVLWAPLPMSMPVILHLALLLTGGGLLACAHWFNIIAARRL